MESQTRAVYRRQVTNIAKSASDYLNSTESQVKDENKDSFDLIEEELVVLLERLKAAKETLNQANLEIRPTIKAEDIAKEAESVAEYEDKAISAITRLKQRLSKLQERQRNGAINSTVTDNKRPSTIHLPKIELRKFSGDFKEWLPFWEQFRRTIHENPTLDDVTRFNYLQSTLLGKAAESIAGFTPTESCYSAAIALLMEEYGNNEKIIDRNLQQLMSLPSVSSCHDAAALRRLYNAVMTTTRSLTASGVPSSQYYIMLKSVILKCIPPELRLEFHRHQETQTDIHEKSAEISDDDDASVANSESSLALCGDKSVRDILRFLKREVESLEKSGIAKRNLIYRTPQKITNTAAGLLAHTSETTQSPIQCYFCKSVTHSAEKCNSSLSLIQRKDLLKKEGRCFKCTRRGHNSKNCRVRVYCDKCNNRHATSVCDPQYFKTVTRKSSAESAIKRENIDSQGLSSSSSSAQITASLCSPTVQQKHLIYLQTACAIASASSHSLCNSMLVRIILDGGSQRTYIKQSVADKLKLKVTDTVNINIVPFGCTKKAPIKSFQRVNVELKSLHDNQCISVLAIVVPEICPDILIAPDVKCSKFSNLILADSSECHEFEDGIGLLIGADIYWKVVLDKFKRISAELVAISTIFGWTIQGPALYNCNELALTTNAITLQVAELEDISENIDRFWSLESIGITQPISKGQSDAISWDSYVAKQGQRYEASLLWKDPHCNLNDNKAGAAIRFDKLIKQLSRNSSKFQDYDNVMWELISNGIAERCDEGADSDTRLYYMPHRPVYREDKATSKTRIVFDASSSTGNNFSLNSLLSPGENLLPDVMAVLLNFRMGKIAIVADIEKAFLQISLLPKDRNVHRFFWFEQRLSNLNHLPARVVYRMTRVTFGISCSPFLLCATLKKHFELESHAFAETCEILKNAFYMDDMIVSLNDEGQAFRLYKDTLEILDRACMNIRKWNSNDSYLRKQFSEEELLDVQKVLGVVWYCITDEISIDLENICDSVPTNVTKRNLLQFIARIYDPLGVLGPTVVKLKLLFQESWKLNLGWDEPFPAHLLTSWNNCSHDLPYLKNVMIPRCVFPFFDNVTYQLHIFSDASPQAYGTVAYIRSENGDGRRNVAYLCSKNRIAPLKNGKSAELTLPKLELTATLLGARLYNYLNTHLKIKFDSAYFWSDSKITLCWIHNERKYERFIDHRVKEIRKLTPLRSWRHCPGTDNPADLLTRGITGKNLLDSTIWLRGPDWLLAEEVDWPQQQSNNIAESSFTLYTVSCDEPLIRQPILKMEHFSRYTKMIRVTAYVFRFIDYVKGEKPQSSFVSASELRRAEKYWIQYLQLNAYKEEMIALQRAKSIPKSSTILSLNPVLDEHGIMRVGSRLAESQLNWDEIYPIILPKSSHFTSLLVEDAHERTMHGGVNLVLSRLRENYWIIKARQAVKSIIQRCKVCKRLKGKHAEQPFAPLPRYRLQASRPFETSGIDFAGPLYVKGSSDDTATRKVYILLITCAVTRAVHLELVLNLTTESCISALRRFFARRGNPKIIISDNARTFKRSSLEFKQLCKVIDSEALQGYISHEGITWRFIVERAAWWGGFWERLVKIVKDVLKASIGRAVLTVEQLETLLIEAEAVVNARPLTYISDDPLDLVPLTPAHFLLGAYPSHLDLNSAEATDKDIRLKWRARFRLYNSFCKRFKVEYLQRLRSAHFTNQPYSMQVKVGDVVIVNDPTTHRLFWKLAIVENVFPGRDRKVRACELRFGNGTRLRRAIQQIYPLEINNALPAGGCEKLL